MNTFFWRALRALGCVGCVLGSTGAALYIMALPVHAETRITDGFLARDTVWDTTGSPYIISDDMTIPVGHSLTIDPGVTVQGDPDLGWAPNI